MPSGSTVLPEVAEDSCLIVLVHSRAGGEDQPWLRLGKPSVDHREDRAQNRRSVKVISVLHIHDLSENALSIYTYAELRLVASSLSLWNNKHHDSLL